jgi:hypothetical protein
MRSSCASIAQSFAAVVASRVARNMLVRYTVYQIFEVIEIYYVLHYPSFVLLSETEDRQSV